MDIIEILILSIGLSMDAFSVSISKGLASSRFEWRKALACGIWFGLFQALMPLIGYFLTAQFTKFIESYASWIAFGLLFFIGCNMIREVLFDNDEKNTSDSTSFAVMLTLAIATSIDAMVSGISMACVNTNIWLTITAIGISTFIFSIAGYKIGNIFGSKHQKMACIAGGLILIAIGIKILVA